MKLKLFKCRILQKQVKKQKKRFLRVAIANVSVHDNSTGGELLYSVEIELAPKV